MIKTMPPPSISDDEGILELAFERMVRQAEETGTTST